MKKVIIQLLFVPLFLFALQAYAQLPGEDGAFASREGIFVYLGPAMVNPEKTWNNIKSYSLFRKEANGNQWVMLNEIESPVTQTEFGKRLKQALEIMPYPVDPDLLPPSQIWSDLMDADSLAEAWEWTTWLPVRLAIGIYYYDASAKRDTKYIYRIQYNGLDNTIVDEFEYSPSFYPREADFPAIIPEDQLYTDNRLQLSWKMEGFAGIAWAELQRKDNIAGTFSEVKADISFFESEENVMIYTYVDEAEKDRFFAYRIIPVDYFGNRGKASEEVKTGNFDYFMDVRLPDSIKAASSQEPPGIMISWEKISNPLVNSVSVFRSESLDGDYEEIVTLNPGFSNYVDASVIPMTKYFYYLQLNGYAGGCSPRSSRFFGIFRSENAIPPPVVYIAEGENGNPEINIRSTDIRTAGFRVYRRSRPDPDWKLVSGFIPANDSVVVYLDENINLRPGRFYDYAAVSESHSNVESTRSDYVTLKHGTDVNVASPLNLLISEGDGIVRLSWNHVSDDNMQGFLVYRKEIPEGYSKDKNLDRELITAALLPDYATFFIDSSASVNTRYEYSVEAVDVFGNRSNAASIVYSGYAINNFIAPVIQAVRKTDGIMLSWKPCFQEGILNTIIKRKTSEGKYTTMAEILHGESCMYNDNEVFKGTRYTYYLLLETDDGQQINSNKLIVSF